MWKTINTFVQIESPWLTLIGENVHDESQQKLEYWRVEKADSVIALPIYNDQIVLAQPYYRHGIQEMTYDFPGGRKGSGDELKKTVFDILKRELAIDKREIESVSSINDEGWNINSSFSNQKLFGFVAEISSSFQFKNLQNIHLFPLSEKNINKLLLKLNCLQCRALLLEWYYRKNKQTLINHTV